MAHVDGGHEVPNMWRVEGAPEETDAGEGHGFSSPAGAKYTPAV